MPRLTEREWTIREGRAMMARAYRDAGWSLRAIARELKISEGTVRNDLRKCATSAHFMAPRRPKLRTSFAPDENVVQLRRQA